MNVPQFVIHSSIERHLSCFLVSVTINIAAINTHMQVFV